MGIEYSFTGSYNTGIHYDTLKLDYKKLSTLFNNNDTEILNKLTHLQIHNLTENKFDFSKLSLCPNLISLRITLRHDLYDIPKEILELKKLTDLYITSVSNKINILNITNISKLSTLQILKLTMCQSSFPAEILLLNNLEILKLDFSCDIVVPNLICNLDKLYELKIIKHNTICPEPYIMEQHQNYYILDNKMMIVEFNNCIKIPKNITELNILHANWNNLTNLPNNITILRIQRGITQLTNLPVSLEKLYINNNRIDIEVDKIKLPYGCKLILFYDF
jgi:hypothetical protein